MISTWWKGYTIVLFLRTTTQPVVRLFDNNKNALGGFMTKTQEKYLEYLSKAGEILKNSEISQEENDVLKHQIENIEFIIPVVGGFSAGKSTIINDFLGENLLATNLTPETALATELRYSTSNHIEAIRKDGESERYEINDVEKIKQNAEKYQYLKYYLNNKKIKQIQPLVLVDMPGFSAPIAHHNQAIMNYLSRGIYFIVAISVEDGTIQKNILREISNIMSFGKGFTFCLTKTNLKTPSDVKEIAQEVSRQLKDYFDYQEGICLLGRDASEEMQKILSNISPEKLTEKMFLEDLKQNQNKNISDLNMQISAFKINKEEIEETVEELKSSIQALSRQKEEEIAKIQSKYTLQNIEGIVTKIGDQLFVQKEQLSSLILNSQESFNSEINGIIRQILVSNVQLKISEINQNIIEDIKLDLKNLQNIQVDMQWVDVLASEIQKLLSGLQEKTLSSKQPNDALSKVAPMVVPIATKYLPRFVAIPATMLNPILGAITAFLPEIVSFFKGKKQEELKREKALEYFVNNVIPAIKANARKSLDEMFSRCIRDSIDFIYAEFEKQIQAKQSEMENIQAQRKADAHSIDQKIEELIEVRTGLQSIAEKYLY